MSRLSLGLPVGQRRLFNYRAGDDLGDAGIFVRGNVAGTIDGNGVVQVAASGVLRNRHYVPADSPALLALGGDGLDGAIKTTLLESAGKNFALWSEELSNAVYTVSNIAVTDDFIDAPDGTMTGDRMDLGVEIDARIGQNVSPANSITNGKAFTVSCWVRSLTGTTRFRLNNTHGGVANQFSNDMEATTTWKRFSFTVFNAAVAGNGIQTIGLLNETAGGIKTVCIWGFQLEESPFMTSYISNTTGQIFRPADLLKVANPFPPQAQTLFLKLIQLGTISQTRPLTTEAGSSDVIRMMVETLSGSWFMTHDNGPQIRNSGVILNDLPGDLIEFAGQVYPDGSVQSHASLNNAAVVSGTRSTSTGGVPFAATWPTTEFTLGAKGNGDTPADMALIAFKNAPGVRSLDEMRVY